MNSKEALENYHSMACYQSVIVDDTSHYEAIKKDLEILDIIKRWSFIQENYKDGYGPFSQFLCNIHTIGMEEDFKKVKDWLENERISEN